MTAIWTDGLTLLHWISSFQAGERIITLESKVQQLQSDAKKYQSEILFQRETLQQREAEYNNLSRKLKELMEEKEGLERELSEVKDSLHAEKVG